MQSAVPAVAVIWVLAACAVDDAPCAPRFALENASTSVELGVEYTVLLAAAESDESCTGVLVSSSAILTAAHCAGRGPSIERVVRLGARAEACLRLRGLDGCAPITFGVHRVREGDLAVLVSASPLAGMVEERLPVLHREGRTQTFQVYGYGAGSFRDDAGTLVDAGHAQRLLRGDFEVQSESSTTLTAVAMAGQSAVCDGDSGAPAVMVKGGVPVILGVLADSDVAINDASSRCTPTYGLQIWTRVEPLLTEIAAAVGSCAPGKLDGLSVVDCRGLPVTTCTE